MNRINLANSRLLALACIVFVLLVLSACSDGSGPMGGPRAAPEPPPAADGCDDVSVPVDDGCEAFAVRLDERADTPFGEGGKPVTLEVVLYKPLHEGRHPTLVFHHGSTGSGSDPSLYDDTFTSKTVTQFFVERGWLVAFPQRRGRGASDGLYDEGFNPDRSAYSCRSDLALGGAAHALDDLDAITEWLRGRADVDTTRLLVAGTSRGGILSVAHVARRPEVYLGAVNFVGGWLGEGCGDYRAVNATLFREGARFPGPTLWLYGVNDSFYGLPYSRTNFDAYTSAGGLGSFHEFTRAAGLNGHFLINDPELWQAAMDGFLGQL